MSHSCIASLRVIHASKERETLHNIPDLAISMACSHLCVLFSSCVYIHTAHTQPTSATHSSTGRLLRTRLLRRLCWPAAGRPVGVASRLSHSCACATGDDDGRGYAVLRWLRSDLPLQSPSYPPAERQEQAGIVEFPVYLPRTSRDIDTNTRQRLGKADREGRESIPEINFTFS